MRHVLSSPSVECRRWIVLGLLCRVLDELQRAGHVEHMTTTKHVHSARERGQDLAVMAGAPDHTTPALEPSALHAIPYIPASSDP